MLQVKVVSVLCPAVSLHLVPFNKFAILREPVSAKMSLALQLPLLLVHLELAVKQEFAFSALMMLMIRGTTTILMKQVALQVIVNSTFSTSVVLLESALRCPMKDSALVPSSELLSAQSLVSPLSLE
jgi:hypothetical protein